MTKVFTPPIVQDRPPYLPDSAPDQVGLWRHFASRKRGVNVYKLKDGSYVQDVATPENSNTNIPYPLNVNDPNAPYVRVHNFDGTETDIMQANPCVHVYYGGHTHVVSDAEATALTNFTAHGIGYGADLT